MLIDPSFTQRFVANCTSRELSQTPPRKVETEEIDYGVALCGTFRSALVINEIGT
jgi:hypothetical protein